MQKGPPFISHLSASLLQRRPLLRAGLGHLLLRRRLTWHPREPLDPPSLALELPSLRHATPANRVAATSPSPWPAQRHAPDPQLAHALAPRAPPQHIPLTPSPLPRSEPPERHRRPPARRRARSRREPAIPDPLRPFIVAAGDRRRRIRPVKHPPPSLTTARDPISSFLSF